jgi:hypothetical protein
MIDNIEQIKQLLNFENKGDFYMLYVFKRKKEQLRVIVLVVLNILNVDMMRLNNSVRCLRLVHISTFRNKTTKMYL